uniref:Rx N-terminal domain-containing protein n=1 Tax=Leersia perrieri TaxID=77586 RepID=A0A0D9WPD0_9ORYZ
MAETVLSITRSLLGSAISKAASAAAEEMSLLMNVFLNAAEQMKKNDELLKVWAGQVRDLAYDIEDCLDEFRVHLERQSLLCQLKKLKHRHRIAIMIRNLKSRAEHVSNRNRRYKLIDIMPSNSTDKMDSYLSVNNIDEASLLGLDGPQNEVLQLLDIHNNSGRAKVICVVGMGGLGKTTLAKKVYESNAILDKFSRYAWITVSQSFDMKELLIGMITKLMDHDSLDKRSKDLQRKQSSKEF